MRRTIASIIALIALIFACTSGLVEPITKVFVWLITLNFNSPDISVFGQLVAKYGTWIIVYALVGAIFGFFDWFNSTAMKIVYFIISTILSFLFSWLIMFLETYLWIIAIVVGVLLILLLSAFITLFIVRSKKKKEAIAND